MIRLACSAPPASGENRPARRNARSRLLESAPQLLLTLLLAGCGAEVELGQVQGRVLLDGQPVDQVRVLFLPDPERGGVGTSSSAVSDARGYYRLSCDAPDRPPGAAVGWHRITLEDFAAENTRGSAAPPPVRIAPRYSSAQQTPLSHKVRAGNQTRDLLLSSSDF